MKTIKRGVILSLYALFIAQGTQVFAQTTDATAVVNTQNDILIKLRADIIEWRYKTENGKLYARQYNASKQVWIGEWRLIS